MKYSTLDPKDVLIRRSMLLALGYNVLIMVRDIFTVFDVCPVHKVV